MCVGPRHETISFMIQQTITTIPLQGKTYSLHGSAPNSDGYYDKVAELANMLLKQIPDIRLLLTKIQTLSRSRLRLRRIARDETDHSLDRFLIKTLRNELALYTSSVASHLRGLSTFKRWDRTLATSEEQYHLYMLEIELVNRLYREKFHGCARKLAFLPHCLRDLTADCRAAQRDLDYVCKGCSVDCNVNRTTKSLRRHGVKPYIWMTANLRALFKRLKTEENSLGVLGIACIPELVRGMRLCLKFNVPVVGIPLDANRCARWWGEFHWNMVNADELENLLAPDWSTRGEKSC